MTQCITKLNNNISKTNLTNVTIKYNNIKQTWTWRLCSKTRTSWKYNTVRSLFHNELIRVCKEKPILYGNGWETLSNHYRSILWLVPLYLHQVYRIGGNRWRFTLLFPPFNLSGNPLGEMSKQVQNSICNDNYYPRRQQVVTTDTRTADCFAIAACA